MPVEWETVESGPADAGRTVLLLPGGMCSARSYAGVVAEPALAAYRLVAATLPGHCGTQPPADFGTEHCVFSRDRPCDVGAGLVAGDRAEGRRCGDGQEGGGLRRAPGRAQSGLRADVIVEAVAST